jgi:hypothetical protein
MDDYTEHRAQAHAQAHAQRQRSRALAQSAPTSSQDALREKAMKKAERARESRKKKKEYVQYLEDRVKELGEKIQELQTRDARERAKARIEERKLRLQLGKEEENSKRIRDEQRQLVSRIRSSLQRMRNSARQSPVKVEGGKGMEDDNSNAVAVVQTVQLEDICRDTGELMQVFIQNWKERQSQSQSYLNRLSECLLPGVQAKFILWLLSREESFYSNHHGLWTALVHELGITEQQGEELLQCREAITAQKDEVLVMQKHVEQVRLAIHDMQDELNGTVDELSSCLTPLQLGKFILWVDENNWCMQMLNSLWTTTSHQGKPQELL